MRPPDVLAIDHPRNLRAALPPPTRTPDGPTVAYAVLLAGLACAAGTVAVAPVASGAEPVTWSHELSDPVAGPAHWAELDPDYHSCADGSAQSPIDLTRHAARADLPPLRFRYARGPLVVENTGHTVEVASPSPGATLQVGRDTYELQQFHVHVPSEHTVRGRHTDLEVHLVHKDAAGRLAVVGLLLDAGRHGKPLVSRIAAAAPHEPGEEATAGRGSAADLLPASTRQYSTYAGSLTTPPCTEGVRWFVLDEVQQVSPAALRQLHALVSEFPGYHGFADNDRPVQPLNSRQVLHTRR